MNNFLGLTNKLSRAKINRGELQRMKCFNHPQSDAIGMCKNCQKGLCSTCVVDVGDGLACRNSCEGKVRLLNKITEKSVQTLEVNATVYKGTSVFFFVLGIIMLLMGASKIFDHKSWLFETSFGLLCILFSFMSFSASRKLEKN